MITRLFTVLLMTYLPTLKAETPLGNDGDRVQKRQQLLKEASRLLDEAQVSYVYGGHQLGDSSLCEACNRCLSEHHPAPSLRLKVCKVCESCSIDCSHFTALVFGNAGLPYPYLETNRMLSLPAAVLKERYQFVDLGDQVESARPGDLLVYDGHVVLLEKVHGPRLEVGVSKSTAWRGALIRGDIVHATGGGSIRRPGEGIQRQRFVELAHFRGPLRRILRHVGLSMAETADLTSPLKSSPALPDRRRLRPVLKASGDDS